MKHQSDKLDEKVRNVYTKKTKKNFWGSFS